MASYGWGTVAMGLVQSLPTRGSGGGVGLWPREGEDGQTEENPRAWGQGTEEEVGAARQRPRADGGQAAPSA